VASFGAGWNQPGYLPETDPFETDDWTDARDYLAEEMREHADNLQTWADPHNCDDIPCPTYGDDCPWQTAADMRLAVDEELLQLQEGQTFLHHAGGFAYWLDRTE